MDDRDHFAAAALTGLLAQGDDGSFSEESYVRGAYRWADVMLREQARNGAPTEGGVPAGRSHSYEKTDAERGDSNTSEASEMTGLITRLRDWRSLHLTRLGGLFDEAADEIERLRAENARLRELCEIPPGMRVP